MYGPAVSLLAGALALLQNDRPAPPDSSTRLVVLIVVDQLRPDELLRYRAEWTGGFKRVLEQGVVFTHGVQDHAITQTAPGHATLLSGRVPAHTGIVTNDLGVPDSLAPVIGAPTMVGASPRRFQGTTLADWMLAHDSSARMLSVSRKDRGAILPIGRSREQVYWWSTRGGFSTSRYYRDTLPEWVAEWNGRNPARRLAGRTWDLLKPAAEYSEPDSLPTEKGPDGRATFPHQLADDPAVADSQVIRFPWMDSLTIDLALTGVSSLGLGAREGHTDLLSVSLSTVDEAGHDYGPNSREMHDMLLRLDGYLGWFLDSLAATVPAANTIVVLASDHGVQPIPEQSPAAPATASVRVTPRDIVREMARALRDRWRTDFGIRFDYGIILADVAALDARGVDTDSLSQALARRLVAEPYVERVYTPRSLAVAPQGDRLATRWRHTIPASLGWLAAVTAHEGLYWGTWPVGADHGTPWPADEGIPIVFWGGGISPMTVSRPVRSVDIAPTLARRLGILPTERVDGVVLPEVARAAR